MVLEVQFRGQWMLRGELYIAVMLPNDENASSSRTSDSETLIESAREAFNVLERNSSSLYRDRILRERSSFATLPQCIIHLATSNGRETHF